MTRDLMAENRAAAEARGEPWGVPGGWTRNVEVPKDYEGKIVILAVLRIGDHAHVIVYTGRQDPRPEQLRDNRHYGRAGHLIIAWPFWEWLRDTVIDQPGVPVIVKEVENPKKEQLDHHLTKGQ